MKNTHPDHVLLQPMPLGMTPIKWYEQNDSARGVMAQFPDFTFSHLEWQSHCFPGGYEIYYIVDDGGTLCHQCANKELERTIDPDDSQFYIVDRDVNWEDVLGCDHCGRLIGPEYGDEDEDEGDNN